MNALVAALYVGRRKGYPATPMMPHSLTLSVVGAGMLWFGWFGFNAGSALAADGTAGMTLTATQVSAAVDVPVAADTENGFADDPAGVAETVTLACATGLAGCSIEDFTGRADDPIYDVVLAAERVAAAVEAAHRGPTQLVLTARAENHIHGRDDLADTIARLQAYQEAGADVLFAPGVTALDDIASVVSSVDRPVNVLALPGCAPVDELASIGVARVSVGGAYAYVALAALIDAASELRDHGTYGYWQQVADARGTIRGALRS
jgi:2-methylisocitrate lyase-like PEP mutase family enzyme